MSQNRSSVKTQKDAMPIKVKKEKECRVTYVLWLNHRPRFKNWKNLAGEAREVRVLVKRGVNEIQLQFFYFYQTILHVGQVLSKIF